MQLVISPAMTMAAQESFLPLSRAAFLPEAEYLLERLRRLSYEELAQLWGCSKNLLDLNYERLAHMDLRGASHELSPAILSFQGLQYQHIGASVMSEKELFWLREHLYIASGLYGLLRPFDAVEPYRLEMQAPLFSAGVQNGSALQRSPKNLYEFWGTKLTNKLFDSDNLVINLCSQEYTKAICPGKSRVAELAKEGKRFVHVHFGMLRDGRFKQRATEAKTARGTFVHWCAGTHPKTLKDLLAFSELGYAYSQELSCPDDPVARLVFCK